jgi:hypothetical protein
MRIPFAFSLSALETGGIRQYSRLLSKRHLPLTSLAWLARNAGYGYLS